VPDLGDSGPSPESAGSLPTPINWHDLFEQEDEHSWLVDDFWPKGRQLHLFAARKTGKSLLMLWVAACLAVGRDPFKGTRCEPRKVIYLDYEMTQDDLSERIEEMGFEADALAGHLFYYLLPNLPPLDTAAGGRELMKLVERDGAEVVILDTLSRVVEGKEDSNDTFRALFHHTGSQLKREKVSLARLDHEGHQGGRSRGASAKADDVDVVWQIKKADSGLALINKAARIPWVAQRIELTMTSSPLQFSCCTDEFSPAARAKAAELDELGLPIEISRRKAAEAMKEAGLIPGRSYILTDALRYRKSRDAN
jgi:hypothetical protein